MVETKKRKPPTKQLAAFGCLVTYELITRDDQDKDGDMSETRCLCQTADKCEQNLTVWCEGKWLVRETCYENKVIVSGHTFKAYVGVEA